MERRREARSIDGSSSPPSRSVDAFVGRHPFGGYRLSGTGSKEGRTEYRSTAWTHFLTFLFIELIL
jgi:hypothetical protein